MPSQYSPFLDMEVVDKEDEFMPEDEEDLVNYGRRKAMNATPQPPPKSKSKRPSKMFNNLDGSGAFHQTRGGLHQEMLPPGLRMKKLGKFDQNMDSDNNRINNSTEEFWVKVSNNNNNNQNSGPPNFRTKYWASLDPSANSRKRERDALEEIVASIKLLGEGFVKMEKAKMEMAREMEAMRMEMEMKRNEMLLESQKQIVDAFLKGFFELKKSKKVKTTDPAASEDP
ncbi:UNVERIFIED_CONTAM: protein FIP2 [Sesamum radiatum]|uniref:Protein FIP2 n=1 Tax=Sesamum radiatum TaxID=300843 RepID=A0AAW2NL60_SESRA